MLLAELTLPTTFLAAGVVISLSVCLHALAMREVNARVCNKNTWVWARLSLVVLVLLAVHLLEILAFGTALHLLTDGPGDLDGDYDGSFADSVYFSAMVYTTVGFGDIIPVGPLRLLVAAEALSGLVLIAWSASFTFFVMSRMDDHKMPSPHAASSQNRDDEN